MKKEDFIKIYDKFKSIWQDEKDVQGTETVWNGYKERIIVGLPFEKEAKEAGVSW